MLTAYFDESGIDNETDWCVVAGFIGRDDTWTLFSQRWKAVLERHGVEVFHAADFFPPSARRHTPAYTTWSDARCLEFISELAQLLRDFSVFVIGAVMDVRAFRGLSYGERKRLTYGLIRGGDAGLRWESSGSPETPWFVGFQWCVGSALYQHSKGSKVSLIFDRQAKYKSRALEIYEHDRSKARSEDEARYGGLSFCPKESALPLQAADLFSYLARRNLRRDLGWTQLHDTPFQLIVSRRLQGEVVLFGRERIEKYLAEGVDEEFREWVRRTNEPRH